MAALTSDQRRWRQRTERLIALAEPGLNLVLAVGDRISRLTAGAASEPLAGPPAPDGPVRRAMKTAR